MTEQEDPPKYHRIVETSATYAISSIGEELGVTPLVLHYEGKAIEICSTATGTSLGLTAKKLLDFMLLLLTKYNSDESGWTRGTLRFMLEDFMRIMGYPDTRQARHRCFDMIREDIAKLGSLRLMQNSDFWFELLDGDWFICDTSDKRTKRDIIAGNTYFEVRFHDDFLAHLSARPRIVPFPAGLFQWLGKNGNAYAFAKRLVLHHNINSRTKHSGPWRLGVSTLLNCCPDKANLHKGNVRRTFEKALNFLAAESGGYGPLIAWEYVVGKKKYEPKEISALHLSHEDWQELVVEFTLKGSYAKTEYVERGELDTAYRRFLIEEIKYENEDDPNIMRKRKTDPQLLTPNAFMQVQMDIISESMSDMMELRFESLICEQIWLVRKSPPYFIRNLRDSDGYLELRDLTAPTDLHVDQTKRLSLTDCREKPMSRLLWDPVSEEDRILAVTSWTGGLSPFAQVAILKRPDDELGIHAAGLIKREYEGHVYYMGRFFDVLTAMFNAGLLPPWTKEDDRRSTTY